MIALLYLGSGAIVSADLVLLGIGSPREVGDLITVLRNGKTGMRALILGLILVNVLYWTWSGTTDRVVAPLPQALDPDLPRLELVERESVPDAQANDIQPALVGRVGSDDVLSVDQINSLNSSAQPPGTNQPEVSEPTDLSSLPPIAGAVVANDQTTPADQPIDAPDEPLVVDTNLLAAVDPMTHPARCIGVGPFTSLRQASEAAAILNQAGLSTSQRVEEAQVWVGHWVHLPAFPSRAAAVVVVERLRKEGVKDIYIEPSGELKNTVSLGLFTELERAEIRAGKVRKLGEVKPQIRNRSRDGLVYWIDMPIEAGINLEPKGLLRDSKQELKVQPVDCPPAVARG